MAPNWKVRTLLGLTTLAAPAALAKPCVGFDSDFNLYVFGGTTDYFLGSQNGWFDPNLSAQAQALTTTGRPPFNGSNTQCFLAQFFNALYVLDADNSLPSAIHIFNFVSRTWSTLTIGLNGVSHQSVLAILDRDTNVFFGLDKSTLYRLDMALLNAADGTPRGWEVVGNPPFMSTINYTQPVLALAQNHIHFLNVGQPAQADIFVIHFSYFQPEVQSYPGLNGASGFPSTHGQTASVFKGFDAVQTKFAFWPDDKSSTYVIDVLSNTTSVMPAPSDKSSSVFAAGQYALVQLTTGGDLYGIAFSPDNDTANAQASWRKISTPKLNFSATQLQQQASSSSGNPATHGTVTSTTGTVVPTSSSPNSKVAGGGARRMLMSWGMTVAGLALGAIAFVL